jgi:hypothetical protein
MLVVVEPHSMYFHCSGEALAQYSSLSEKNFSFPHDAHLALRSLRHHLQEAQKYRCRSRMAES